MPASVSTAERERFVRDGYLIVDDVVDPAEAFAPVWAEFDAIVDDIVAGLAARGARPALPEGAPFTERLLALTTQTGNAYAQHFDISLPRFGVTPHSPINVGPAMFELLRNPRLLDLVEEFVGPEILSSPVQHVRIKLPESDSLLGDAGALTRVPWHQDQGVLLPEADATNILTVWLPLTAATIANGCLCVIPGSHHGGLVTHCPLSSKQNPGGIPEQLVTGDPVAVPMTPGSVLLLHPTIMHTSFSNTTANEVRVSLDLRYQPVGQPTGRPAFPGFVARSRTAPHIEVRQAQRWAASWAEARERISRQPVRGGMSRWRPGDPLCA